MKDSRGMARLGLGSLWHSLLFRVHQSFQEIRELLPEVGDALVNGNIALECGDIRVRCEDGILT
jgi:hypothetical protein